MENQLAALKKALELGADIHISFHTDIFGTTENEEQENKIKEVAEILGYNYQELSHRGSKWLTTPKENTIKVIAFLEDDENASSI